MKDDKFLILLFSSICLLGLVTYWQFKQFRQSLSNVEIPQFEMPKLEFPLSQESKELNEFISPDEKLKLKYLADWTEMPKQSLEALNQEAIKKGAEVLFFAQKFKLEKGAFASLIIQEMDLEKEKSLKDIIEERTEEVKEKEGEMEIVNQEIGDKEALIEASYKRKEGTILYSKEKAIMGEDKLYLVSIVTLNKDWSEFEKEVNEIFDSIQSLE